LKGSVKQAVSETIIPSSAYFANTLYSCFVTNYSLTPEGEQLRKFFKIEAIILEYFAIIPPLGRVDWF
jgi:hypothetical protein